MSWFVLSNKLTHSVTGVAVFSTWPLNLRGGSVKHYGMAISGGNFLRLLYLHEFFVYVRDEK